MNIKDMVSNGKKVKFTFYKNNELWYITECGFTFPVPIDDCGDGVFLAEDKAMLFMRYIRKHIKFLDDAQKEVIPPAPVTYTPAGIEAARTIDLSTEPAYPPWEDAPL